jgi:hypothetical protein
MLPYRATRAKANAQFNEQYSEPLKEGEFIAIRDEPTGPIYVAEVMSVLPASISLHYYGTTGLILATAIFKPCWHEVSGTAIILDFDPGDADINHLQFIPYSGDVDLKETHTVLVACQLEFTKADKLRFRSLRSLTPVHDQIFRFERYDFDIYTSNLGGCYRTWIQLSS